MEQKTTLEGTEKKRFGGRARYAVLASLIALAVLGVWWFLTVGGTPEVLAPGAETASNETEVPDVGDNTVSGIEPGKRVIENGVTTTLVYLTARGFVPEEVTIQAGEEVRFINVTEGAMRIGARSDLSSPFYATVVQPDVVSYEGVYQVGLSRVGLWSYENLTSSGNRAQGVIFIR